MRRRRAILVVSFVFLIAVTLTFVSRTLRLDRYGFSQIDWVDVIRYDGKNYVSPYPRMAESAENIGRPIGSVRFTLSDSVHNPEYRLRDFDAAFLPEGTQLFLVGGGRHSIAALVGNVY